MNRRTRMTCFGVAATAVVALALMACRGAAGQNGTNGTNGKDGKDGVSLGSVMDAKMITPDQWAELLPVGKITSASVAGAPVINFQITDKAGNGIKGLGFTTQNSTALMPSLANMSFSIVKLVPEDPATKRPSRWVSYIVTSTPTKTAASAPTRPTTDNTGTLVDNGNGTYQYTFYRDITKVKAALDAATYTGNNLKADLDDVTFEPNLTHRVSIQFAGNARGTGTNTPDGVQVATAVPMKNPINVIYDFIPATGKPVSAADAQREVVSVGKCNECHERLGATGFHGGSRMETQYCVVCHTDQRKYGYADAVYGATGYDAVAGQRKIDGTAVGDFTAMIHRIHQGKELSKKGYNYANVYFNKIGYSILEGGQKMCLKCHSGAAQAEQYKTKPSRLACGTCHDAINWATGENHAGGKATSDNNCAGCHNAAYVVEKHQAIDKTKHNPVIKEGLKTFAYEIASAAVNSDNSVSVKFKITADGTPVTFLAPAANMSAPLAGFTGSPSFLLAWAKSQDGIAEPADYNNLGSGASNAQPLSVSIANLLNTTMANTHGTLSGPDSSGYYTAKLVGTRVFPVGSKLRAVALQGYFTQVSAPASTTAPVARHAISVIKAIQGDAVRRVSADSAKCFNCHEWFQGHGGNRVYEVAVCVTCHNPNITTSGRGIADATLVAWKFTEEETAILASWGFDKTKTNAALSLPVEPQNFKDMIHGIHAGKDRTEPIKIVRDRTPSAINIIDGAGIGFPARLNTCTNCHTYNGYGSIPANALASAHEANNGAIKTPADVKASLLTAPNASDRVTTPFTAACVTCHDSTAAKAHMTLNGGQFKVVRSSLNMAGESCAVCHGPGATYDPVKVHQ